MNEQLKVLVWELDREIWAKVESKEATTSWARQESAKLIQEYSDQQNKELREKLAGLKMASEEDDDLVIQLRKEIQLLKERNKYLEEHSNELFEQANELNDQDQEIQRLRKEVEELKVKLEKWVFSGINQHSKINKLKKKLQQAKTSDERGWKAVDRLRRGNDALRNQVDDLNDELTRLRELLGRIAEEIRKDEIRDGEQTTTDLLNEIHNALNHKP